MNKHVKALTIVVSVGLAVAFTDAFNHVNAVERERFIKIDRFGNASTGDWNCVYDTETGLLWEKGSAFFQMSWRFASAMRKTGCGRTEWRLPTVQELTTLVRCKTENGVAKSDKGYACVDYENTVSKVVDTRYFPAIGLGGEDSLAKFWTSETQDVLKDTSMAVDFLKGVPISLPKRNVADAIYVTPYAPISQMCEYPTWDAKTNILSIPKFDANPLIASIVLQIDLKQDTFTIVDYK